MSNIFDFSGVWRSKYSYHSDSRNHDYEDTHYVRIYQKRNHLVVESLPEVNESYLIVNLTVHDDLATGSWQETTAPKGYYKGATYHGAVQLFIEDGGKTMRGKWLGAGKNKDINVGPYELTYVGKELPADAEPVKLEIAKD